MRIFVIGHTGMVGYVVGLCFKKAGHCVLGYYETYADFPLKKVM